ncbi:hypothetical protein ACB098_01G062200 [Castanea mollissima]
MTINLDMFSPFMEDIIMSNVYADASKGSPSKKIDCGSACSARCQSSSRPNLCNRACGTCCAQCSCIPQGTSGNRDVCPCYSTMITSGGQLKCP